jgi:hypothetical protein
MRTDRWPNSGLLSLGMVLCSLTGCPGTLDDRARFLVDAGSSGNGTGGGDARTMAEAGASADACGDVVTRIFIPSCGGTGCHGSTGAQQGLDLVSDGVASRVVGVAGRECPTPLADPTNPQASLIYQKLSATPPCGAPMPLARPPLSIADAACVLAWIAAQ